MRHAHGRIRLVDVLAAGTARTHRVDANVLGPDIDIDLLRLGEHRYGCRRGVDPAARFSVGNALHAVHANSNFSRANTPSPEIDAMISL